MNTQINSICLNMIVKNESEVIRETLENVCQHFPISTFVICDTGSTDNTIQVIETFFAEKQIRGEVLQHQWKNFEHNRNLALQACKGKADYILVFDADDLVEGEIKLPFPLTSESYYFNFARDNLGFMRKALIKNNGKHFWKGVVHELLLYQGEQDQGILVVGDYRILSRSIGGRSKDPNTWINDAKMLEEAYVNETGEFAARYAFYCAQSYFSAKNYESAEIWYKKRIQHHINGDGWDQEAYQSCSMLAEIYRNHLKNDEKLLYSLHQGIEINAERAECWYWLAYYYSQKNMPEIAYYFAQNAVAHKQIQVEQSFINQDIYDWACDYELCVNAFKLGKINESYLAFKNLLPYDGLVRQLIGQLSQYLPLIENEEKAISTPILNRLLELDLIKRKN